MIQQSFNDIFDMQLAKNAIINTRHPGFKEDYLVIHCLIRKYSPKSIFEIGTNTGFGTKIIKNAIGGGRVISLDLPEKVFHAFQAYPERIGQECNVPYIQLYGDSMSLNYSEYPADSYFIDGAHDYEHVKHETQEIIKLKPQLIIYHDADIHAVYMGILAGMWDTKDYDQYRVNGTRIAYAVKKEA